MSKRPVDPFADQKTCVKCKFFQLEETPSPDGHVDHTIYTCTQVTPHVLCYDNRRVEGVCGPDGAFWTAKE